MMWEEELIGPDGRLGGACEREGAWGPSFLLLLTKNLYMDEKRDFFFNWVVDTLGNLTITHSCLRVAEKAPQETYSTLPGNR